MGLGLLPIEKIPLFIWGGILVAIGGYLLLSDEFVFSIQWKNVLIIAIGLFAIVFDARKRLGKYKKQQK